MEILEPVLNAAVLLDLLLCQRFLSISLLLEPAIHLVIDLIHPLYQRLDESGFRLLKPVGSTLAAPQQPALQAV